MKHIRRAIKYFIQITLLFVVIIGALMLCNLVSRDINVAFNRGWNSVWMILAMFFAVSLAYPFFGYGKRDIRAEGDPADYRKAIDKAMETRGYIPESEEDGVLRYRLSSTTAKIARLWEDAITITPVLGGFQAEGLSRDLARVVMSIEHNISRND